MENTESAENNIAFIDGQNLHFGARENGWFIDHKKLRVYLLDKYKIKEAYYFLGFQSVNEQELYDNLTSAGYILMFKEHAPTQGSRKRGNVDSDIIFNLMKKLVDNEPFDRAFIVSGDGDYKKLVDYLITKGKFGKMLFPRYERGQGRICLCRSDKLYPGSGRLY